MLELQCAGLKFKIQWIYLLLTLILSGLFTALGFWQLHRAEEKKLLLTNFQQSIKTPLPFNQIQQNNIHNLRYRPIIVKGVYDNAHTLLLDNKINQHRLGYEVLTPLLLSNNSSALLINRGWIPKTTDRRHLPAIPDIKWQQTVKGMIYLPPKKSFTLGRQTENLQLIPAINISEISAQIHKPLYPFVILLSADNPGGFLRNWQPVVSPPYKNIGYAIQWFALAVTLIIIFICLNIKRAK